MPQPHSRRLMAMERQSTPVGPPNSEEYEKQHVHEVYEQIAAHFSSTRYKPWPIVESFLKGLPDGSVGLDIGCGNGKYLSVNPMIFIIGSDRCDSSQFLSGETISDEFKKDRSSALTKIASQHEPHSAIIADALALPHPQSRFDFAISIAVVHHLSTSSRRVMAIKAILETLKCSPFSESRPEETDDMHKDAAAIGGRALIYVWALEQGGSRRGWDEGCEQDVMVPWVMKGNQNSISNESQADNQSQKRTRKSKRKGNRCDHSDKAQGEIYASAEGKTENSPSAGNSEMKTSLKCENTGQGTGCGNEGEESGETTRTFHRYYHLYRSGELERDIIEAGGQILESGYEKDNWWATAVRQQSK